MSIIAWVVTDRNTGRVEEVFTGNRDDLSNVDFERLRSRLERHGYTLSMRASEPVRTELLEFVVQVENGEY